MRRIARLSPASCTRPQLPSCSPPTSHWPQCQRWTTARAGGNGMAAGLAGAVACPNATHLCGDAGYLKLLASSGQGEKSLSKITITTAPAVQPALHACLKAAWC